MCYNVEKMSDPPLTADRREGDGEAANRIRKKDQGRGGRGASPGSGQPVLGAAERSRSSCISVWRIADAVKSARTFRRRR